MRSADALRRSTPRTHAEIVRVAIPSPELNRFFYTAIGGDWFWLDRLPWTYDDWHRYLNRPELQTWLVTVDRVPAGYFELERQAGDDVEIVYFGILPQFTVAGLGGWALSRTVDCAWEMGAKRVWVHTCDLDHPRALANYLARGFQIFKTENKEEDLPERSVGPWPESGKPTETFADIKAASAAGLALFRAGKRPGP
jgi:GNAT superfamily N-acetyltransferase